MNWKNSEIVKGFVRIAEEKGLIDFAPDYYGTDAKTIEEKMPATDKEDIIEKAHPEKTYIAESRGDGALVENQNEQHKSIVETVEKQPTGSLVGRYASIAKDLIKLADKCDQDGLTDLADMITVSAESIIRSIPDK